MCRLSRQGIELDGVLLASLYCENALGLVGEASSHTLVDIEPPRIESIHLTTLLWAAEENAWLLAPAAQLIPIEWVITDLTLEAVTVCVTRDPENGCDVEWQQMVGNATGTSLQLGGGDYSNETATHFFVTVTALDEFGLVSSDELLIILDQSRPTIGNLTSSAFAADSVTAATGASLLNDTVIRLELLGGAFDDDVRAVRFKPLDLRLHYPVQATTLCALYFLTHVCPSALVKDHRCPNHDYVGACARIWRRCGLLILRRGGQLDLGRSLQHHRLCGSMLHGICSLGSRSGLARVDKLCGRRRGGP